MLCVGRQDEVSQKQFIALKMWSAPALLVPSGKPLASSSLRMDALLGVHRRN